MADLHLMAETVERVELESLHAACPPATREAMGLQSQEVGGAFVSIARHAPTIILNRCLGLGVTSPIRRESIEAIADIYRQAGVERYFLQVERDKVTPEVAAWLDAAGLQRHRAWMKFSRDMADPTPTPRSDLTVRQIGPEHGAVFGRIVADAFDLGAVAVPQLAALTGTPGWHLFMSFDGDRPAGTGALYVKDGVGWFDCGATAPDFRRRGAQQAVLAARVDAARALGCHTIATCTGEAVEGDPQHSYHNIQWAGFKEAYLRDNYVPRS
ncbi:MAG: GNAT family N-acetyltransferase [Magnetospiraceae bacterium]